MGASRPPTCLQGRYIAAGSLGRLFFQMDAYLTRFSLRQSSETEARILDTELKDVRAIYKGPKLDQQEPTLGEASRQCVAIDIKQYDGRLFFYFEDPISRDKFYTGLKILYLSVDGLSKQPR